MSREIQQLVDQLAQQLNRPVAIDDPQLRLQCYSPHYDQVDQARLDSILHRASSPGVLEFVHSLGAHQAVEPVRVPANVELGSNARICVPVRHANALLGFLWIIDRDGTLTDDELAQAMLAADRSGLLLYRDQLVQEVERGREREILRDLLAGEENLRHAAVEQISGLLPGSAAHRWTVLVAHPPVNLETLADLTPAFDAELITLRDRPGLAGALHLVRPDHVLLVVVQSGKPAQLRQTELDTITDAYRGAVRSALGLGRGERIVVGVGDTKEQGVDAVFSYEQAIMSCRVAETVAGIGETVLWRNCGVYRTLLGIAPAALQPQRLDPAVRRLLDQDTDGVLATTLECYLDSGTRIKVTADRLNLHRTTLYYRIHRAEEITGLDLSDGGDRLVLHLGLKLVRLAAMLPGGGTAAGG